ncbi:hypothetical protein BABINDRAFT_150274 [Babjeviella inositovora NRRL Y-12698]|uniref:Uncharacterized protein n=1 Tax=Babjeviella inositovora NRRL Y-12698 TaxID=984486 RepID=A0A1E3QNK9_9ASCO|nr:uncharacterized protein BABINDRAFT_150274 [Babjeviella inositovora NRRL Y-12698]ODQ79261.1 hypothetical protein BABINDRAFT_150274 [Babjeviella inositovora NRRL Y-12698]
MARRALCSDVPLITYVHKIAQVRHLIEAGGGGDIPKRNACTPKLFHPQHNNTGLAGSEVCTRRSLSRLGTRAWWCYDIQSTNILHPVRS